MATVNLTPSRLDLVGVRAGDRNAMTVRILSGGVALPLDGYLVQAQARLTPVDITALSAVITVVDSTNGLVMVEWPGEDVRDLLDGEAKWNGVWDMQIKLVDEPPLTVTAGSFAAEMDVTR